MKQYIKWTAALLFSLVALTVSAQVKTITGHVITASDREPAIGANILIKGTTTGVAIGLDGKYSIQASSKDVLVFSLIGYVKQEIVVGDRTVIDIVMKEDNELLDEVVVVGYGSVKKQDLTSSIASVKGDELKSFSSGNVGNALQGKVAGVQIMNTSGHPGAAPKVLIRGISSFGGSDPLYVVDGIPMGNNLNFLNSNDIESMQVLKDASATAIYGTRASNGVVLITTKKGKAGKTTFQLDASYGVQMIRKPDIADGIEYARVMNERNTNTYGPSAQLPFPDMDAVTAGTDWWKETMNRVAPMQNYNLSFQGGNEKATYSGSVGYFKQNSQMDKGWWQKISARFNMEYKFSDMITFGQEFNPRYESWENTPNTINSILTIDPTTSVYIPIADRINDGKVDRTKPINWFARSKHNEVWNPVALVYRSGNDNNCQYGMSTNTYLNITPLKGLTFKTQLGLNLLFNEADSYTPIFYLDNLEKNDNSEVSRSHNNNFDYVWNNILTYDTKLGRHSLTVMGGMTMERYQYRTLSGSRKDLPNDNYLLHQLDAATGDMAISGNKSVNTMVSFLGRLNYNFDGRYYLTATGRYDASSRFPKANRWAFFPSVSAAWRISGEEFLRESETLSNLKLRFGWGQIGNQNISNGAYIDQIGTGYYVFGDGRDVVIATFPNSVSNKRLKWETVEDINLGVDLGLWRDKLTMSAEYYVKTSHDMLMQAKHPAYSGYPTWGSTVWSNVGSIQIKGWEVSLNYRNEAGEFSYDLGLTASHAKSKAKKLANGEALLDGTFAQGSGNITKTEEGTELANFYGYVADGIFQSQTEINSHSDDKGNLMQSSAVPGDLRFRDLNNDGKLDEKDKTYIGNPYPDVTLGLNLGAQYKNFDFSVFLYASIGGDNFNNAKYLRNAGNSNSNVVKGLYDDSWRPDNTGASNPRLAVADNNGNFAKVSSYFVEDASFLRCKTMQLGYTIPKHLMKGRSLRVYVSAQNLFTVTGYSGLDPEVGGGTLTSGIDNGIYPQPRTFLGGLNFTF